MTICQPEWSLWIFAWQRPPKHAHLVIPKQQSEKSRCEMFLPVWKPVSSWRKLYVLSHTWDSSRCLSLTLNYWQVILKNSHLIKKTLKNSYLEIPTYLNKIALYKDLKPFEIDEVCLLSISFWAPSTTCVESKGWEFRYGKLKKELIKCKKSAIVLDLKSVSLPIFAWSWSERLEDNCSLSLMKSFKKERKALCTSMAPETIT